MARILNVLIIDDSALVRKVLTKLFSSAPNIHVQGAAPDPIFAERYLNKNWPDVIILDLEMPRMDGMTFLKKIMREHPTPIIVCSSLTQEGTQSTLDALSAGAFATVPKPVSGIKEFFGHEGQNLIQLVITAATANLKPLARLSKQAHTPKGGNAPHQHHDSSLQPSPLAARSDRYVLIGASTGGTQAIEAVLRGLPQGAPPIAIVQHMPPHFTSALAGRLNHICAVEVKEATDGDRLRQGRVLIAPGGKHLKIGRSGAQYVAQILDTDPVNRHKPSVDVMFDSVATLGGGAHFLGILLTGMGGDGAKGLLALKLARAHTIAQDEKSSVVFGMPKEAIRLGAAEKVLPLSEIAEAILQFTRT